MPIKFANSIGKDDFLPEWERRVSDYQYFEFQAMDLPLGEADREQLRALSPTARITASSFADDYQWEDFKGNPRSLMARWFDLHIHLSSWGTRRLMIRLPQRLVDRSRLDRFLHGVQIADVWTARDNLVVDVRDDGEEGNLLHLENCATVLPALAPLRVDLAAGDWRAFYLLWLLAAERGWLRDEAIEPLPGIGTLNGSLETMVGLFNIDPDLVRAAMEKPDASTDRIVVEARRRVVSAIPEGEKSALLCRLLDDEPHVTAEVRNRLVAAVASVTGESLNRCRTVAQLRARAATLRVEHETTEATRLVVERCRRIRAGERERNARLNIVRRRGLLAWREVEREVNRCNAAAYDRAVDLLLDLKTVAEEDDKTAVFMERLDELRERHVGKKLFLERLWELNVS